MLLTQISVQSLLDLLVGRVSVLLKQYRGRHDLSDHAETTLCHLLFDERLLANMGMGAASQTAARSPPTSGESLNPSNLELNLKAWEQSLGVVTTDCLKFLGGKYTALFQIVSLLDDEALIRKIRPK